MSALPLFRAGVSLTILLLCAVSVRAQEPAKPAGEVKTGTGLDDEAAKLDDDEKPAPPAPSAEPSAAPAASAVPNFPGLEKLTPEQRTSVAKMIGEVATYMQGVRLQEALEKLNAIEEITGENHLVSNMRGGVFTKMRDFKTARAEFEKAASLTKEGSLEGFHPRFNVAELDFVEHKWDVAREKFQKLIPQTEDKGTRQLMMYKIMICNLKEGKGPGRALEGFNRYDNDSPVWYFAQAAVAFSEDKKEEAEEWLGFAAKIYPKEMNDIYQDSLVESGWLQTLQ